MNALNAGSHIPPMTKMLPSPLVLLALVSTAYSWSAPTHQAIATAAVEMLKDLPARRNVAAILAGETPATAATWLDHVREQSREKFQFPDPLAQQESEQFNGKFPNNSDWHFVDYPVGSTAYAPRGKFSSRDDIVHALQKAVRVLEGTSFGMSKRQALRVIFHLVADIHQPLHCSSGYYDLTDRNHPQLLAKVGDPKATPNDRGGNQLYYTKSQQLHALWDRGIPAHVAKEVDLVASVSGERIDSFKSAGDYHAWPEIWASESMVEATEAYHGIILLSASDVPDPRHPDEVMLEIKIALPGGNKAYTVAQTVRAKKQLSRASVHLAQLLSRIKYK